MYGALWRILPGPWWVRVLILAVVVAALLFVCVQWVFPALDLMIAPTDSTVES
ncbi:MAG: hypothetical protein R2717_01760 [Schumannella sp.]|nr:hypothetical protein [Microbacteriaceae bacterium]